MFRRAVPGIHISIDEIRVIIEKGTGNRCPV